MVSCPSRSVPVFLYCPRSAECVSCCSSIAFNSDLTRSINILVCASAVGALSSFIWFGAIAAFRSPAFTASAQTLVATLRSFRCELTCIGLDGGTAGPLSATSIMSPISIDADEEPRIRLPRLGRLDAFPTRATRRACPYCHPLKTQSNKISN